MGTFREKLDDIALDYDRIQERCQDLEAKLRSLQECSINGQLQKTTCDQEAEALQCPEPHESPMCYESRNFKVRLGVPLRSAAGEQEQEEDIVSLGVPLDPTASSIGITEKSFLFPEQTLRFPEEKLCFQEQAEVDRQHERGSARHWNWSVHVVDRWGLLTGGLLNVEVLHCAVIDPMWESTITQTSVTHDGMRLLMKVTNSLAKTRSVDNNTKRSHLAKIYERFHLSPLHPNCMRKRLWDCISVVLLIADVIMLPTSFFQKAYTERIPLFTLLCVIFWTADILISFVTGYYTREGLVEMSWSKIVKHYIMGYFLLDAVVVTLDWVVYIFTVGTAFSDVGRMLFRSARAIRLLRLRKVLGRLSQLIDNIFAERVIIMMNIMKWLACVALASHYIACFWYGLAELQFTDRTWLDAGHLDNRKDETFYIYTTALHWALTQFTPASMEVVPISATERLFACAVIMTALVVFSSFVSGITQSMAYLRKINSEKMYEEGLIRKFIVQRGISSELSVRLWRFVRHHHLTERSLVLESDIAVFKQLPVHMLSEVRKQAFVPVLVQHPLFLLLHRCESEFIRQLSCKVAQEIQLAPGLRIFERDEEIQDMLFVIRGRLMFVEYDDQVDGEIIDPNQWVCELALWANYVYMTGTLLASNRGVHMLRMNACAFRQLARRHPFDLPFISSYALQYVGAFQVSDSCDIMDKNSVTSGPKMSTYIPTNGVTVLFNDNDMIENLVLHTASSGEYNFHMAVWNAICRETKRLRTSRFGMQSRFQQSRFQQSRFQGSKRNPSAVSLQGEPFVSN